MSTVRRTRHMRAVRRTAALWLPIWAVLLGTPAAALAAPGWSAPEGAGVPSGMYAPQITYASGGVATVAYVQVTSQAPLATVLHAGMIPVGGSYVDELTIPSTVGAYPGDVSLSEAPDGAAVIEYTTASGPAANATIAVYALERQAGSDTWGSPITLVPPTTRDATHPTEMVTAIAADGTAAAGVEHLDSTDASPGGDRIDVAVASPAGAWGSPTEISLSGEDNESLRLAFDGADNLMAAFTSAPPSVPERPAAELATRSASTGVWSAPVLLSAASSTNYLGSALQLGVAPDGSAVVAYQLSTSAPAVDTWATTRLGASGAWTAPGDVTPGDVTPGSSSAPEAVGVSPADVAYVVYAYRDSNSGLNCIGAVRARIGGAFTQPACVSPQNYQPFAIAGVAFLGNDAYFAFTGKPNGGSNGDLEGDRWLDGSAVPDAPTTIVAPQPLTPSLLGIEPDQSGGTAVLFSPDDGTTVDASAWDTAGPSLISSAVPATAIAGQPISLDARFTDLWSNPATSPSWSFGDGASGGGTSVTHTYATPGTYVAQATSTDALGNTATKQFTITVTAAPAPSASASVPVPVMKGADALELTAVTESHASWLEKKRAHRRGRQAAVGTVFHFTLSTDASVTITFTGSVPGRKAGKKCVAQTTGGAAHARCRLRVSDAMTISGHSGANALNFLGAISGHPKLTPGHYSVTFTARSNALTSATSELRFVILGR